MTNRHLITSEAVSCGHPDKVADQISDSILDACLAQDPHARVACETMVTKGCIILAGEISTQARVDWERVARDTVASIGYTDGGMGFSSEDCCVINLIHTQSPDIALGVDSTEIKALGAGDQGMMVGFACDETVQALPLAYALAQDLILSLDTARREDRFTYLRPDAKVQVTLDEGASRKVHEGARARRLHTVVLSTQHTDSVDQKRIYADMQGLIHEVIARGGNYKDLAVDRSLVMHINPTGRFVVGGPAGDCGLTGRKLMVDTYGGLARHGGGAFSGKDPTKVDRSGAYMCRYLAKNIIKAGIASSAEVHLAYCIGRADPVALRVDLVCKGKTAAETTALEEAVERSIKMHIDLTPSGIIERLDLRRPIYQATAAGGHFGREDLDLPWERCDLASLVAAQV